MTVYHDPVLLEESVNALMTDPGGIYVDATFGGGGHSKEIVKRLNKQGRLFAFDQDEDAIQNIPTKIGNDKRFMLIRSNFRYLKNFLAYHHSIPVTGVLADLGISSHQINTPERGFSTRFESLLDMRMNKESGLTAGKLINEYSEERLAEVFFQYGELREAKQISRRLAQARANQPISSTNDLMSILKSFTNPGHEFQFFAKVFQAIRIEVNQELETLKEMLLQCQDVIAAKGKLVVIAYHSLEDRLVKNFITTGNFSGETERDAIYGKLKQGSFLAINKKPIEPSNEEIEKNSRARSAKMRIAERRAD